MGTPVSAFLEQLLTEIPKTTREADWRVKNLQGFIDSHAGKIGGGLDGICRQLELGISGSQAARLFKRCTGIGVREYAKRQRLKIAAERLKTTALSVTEIAADLGYRNPWDLQRQFRRLLHLSLRFAVMCVLLRRENTSLESCSRSRKVAALLQKTTDLEI